MKNKLTKLIIIFFFLLIFIKKDIMYTTIYNTTILWFKTIVPNLLPMFIITSLIINSNLIHNICNIFGNIFNKIFKCSKYGIFVYFLSLFTGSPSNAKYTSDLLNNNLISKTLATKLLLFTTNYNPLLIYSLLTNFLNKSTTIKIIFIIISSNIIVGLLNRNIYYEEISYKYKKNSINLSKIIKDTMDTLLMILGVLILFNIIINLLPIHTLLLKNVINGILEITTALSNLKYININTNFKILLSIVYLSFNGLSIHTQIKSILPDTNYKLFFKNRIYSVIISLLLLLLFHSMKLI